MTIDEEIDGAYQKLLEDERSFRNNVPSFLITCYKCEDPAMHWIENVPGGLPELSTNYPSYKNNNLEKIPFLSGAIGLPFCEVCYRVAFENVLRGLLVENFTTHKYSLGSLNAVLSKLRQDYKNLYKILIAKKHDARKAAKAERE